MSTHPDSNLGSSSFWQTPIHSAPADPVPLVVVAPSQFDASLAPPPLSTPQVAARPAAATGSYQRGETVNVWNVPFDAVTMSEAIDAIAQMIDDRTPRYVITANLNYAMLVAEDPSLKPITDQASLILADGQPIVWRSWLSGDGKRLPCRVAGSEMIFKLAQRAASSGWSIYFLGAEPGIAHACAANLASLYPGLNIAGVQSPPYRQLTDQEIQQQFADIRQARPDILLVAFGQPKGEKWIREHYQSLGVPVSIQVGASFDFAAGRVSRAPLWLQKIGMEWAHRMLGDPKRLVPRYYRNAKFLSLTLIREWIAFANERYGSHETSGDSQAR